MYMLTKSNRPFTHFPFFSNNNSDYISRKMRLMAQQIQPSQRIIYIVYFL